MNMRISTYPIYRSKISDALEKALEIDFTNNRLRFGDIKNSGTSQQAKYNFYPTYL